MRGFWKLTWIELKLMLREPMASFFTLVFPLMLLLLFGSIYGNKPTPFFGGQGYVDAMVPAFAVIILGTTGLISLSISMASDREQGVLRRLRTTPLKPLAVLAAKVLVLFLLSAAGMALLVIVGRVVYHLRLPAHPGQVVLGFLLSCAAVFAMGFVIAGVMKTARAAQIVAMVLFYPMMFLSGATIPREVLPEAVRGWARVFPMTSMVTVLRGLWKGEGWAGLQGDVLFLAGIFGVGLVVSALTFRWE
jgi:ABC-2 type transport system permease protein